MTMQTDEHYPLDVAALPTSWTVCFVGDTTVDVQSGFPSGVHNKEGIGIPHLRPMNISRQGELDLNDVKYVASDASPLRVEAGDVLFNNTNSPELIGKTASIPQEASEQAFSNHMTRLRTATGIDPKFVARQLHFLWMSGYFRLRCTNHVNQASISSTTLAATVPLVVAPSEEQSRIVDEIEKQFSRLDAATAALKRVQANLKRYRASVLKVACEGRLVPTEAELARREGREYEPADKLLGRILRERRSRWEADTLAKMIASGKSPKDDGWKRKYNEPASPNISGLPELPEGWCWASVEQLARAKKGLTTGPFGTLISKADQRFDGTPVVGIPNITPGGFVPGDWFYLNEGKASELGRYDLMGGDVVVSRSGTVGEACIIPADQGKLIMSTNLMRIRLTSDLAEWLVLNFKGNATIEAQLQSMCKGSTRPFLNLTILSGLLVAIAPTAERLRIQQALDGTLELHQRGMQTSGIALRRSERLRRAILSQAFEGQLVSQEPTDEPASALLERIRIERGAARLKTAARRSKQELVHA